MILVIESFEEHREKAARSLEAHKLRHKIVATQTQAQNFLAQTPRRELQGIITDLQIMETCHRDKRPEQVNGLFIIAAAIEQKLPIVVCTELNADDCQSAMSIVKVLITCDQYPYGSLKVFSKNEWEMAAIEIMEMDSKFRGRAQKNISCELQFIFKVVYLNKIHPILEMVESIIKQKEGDHEEDESLKGFF